MKKIINILAAVALIASLSSCKNYLDINTDPNSPAVNNITSDMIFPGMEMAVATVYGDLLRIPCGYFAQYYAQTFGTSNYLDYSQFAASTSRSNRAYAQMYQKGINNAVTVMSKSAAEGKWGTYLAATTMKAFAFVTLVDIFGEVPYTEAVAGVNAPKYDDGLTVYKGVLAELDAALAKASPADLVCTNFLFPGEPAEPWIQFANALKLRILTRMTGVNGVNVDEELGKLIGDGNFPDSDVAFKNCWAVGAGLESPFYSEEFSTNFGSTQENVIANIAVVGSMQYDGFVDGRLSRYFAPNGSGKFQGGVSGTNFDGNASADLQNANAWNRPVASYDMPVCLLSQADVLFYIAEYYARTGNAMAEDMYEEAISVSFENAGAQGADDYIAEHPFSSADYKECIGISKWLANAGVDPVEGYTELRRLGFPAFGAVQGSDIYNMTTGTYTPAVYEPFHLYTPLKVFEHIGANQIAARFPYPEISTSANANAPEFNNSDFKKPIFWAE